MKPHSSSSQHEELLSLLSVYCDAAIDDRAGARLETLLCGSDEARSVYVEYLHLHQALRTTQEGADWPSAQFPVSHSTTAPAAAAPPVAGLPTLLQAIRMLPGGEFTVGMLVLLAVAGAIWGVMHLARGNHQAAEGRTLAANSDRSASLSVGSLASDDTARWSQKSSIPADAAVRIGRRYELAAGWVNIELTRGTRVAVEGPAVWQFFSDQRLQLTSGKLVAHVPRAGIGFTVVTPTAEVVDLGTEFGVEVDSQGATDLHVIRGRVELKSTAPSASSAQAAAPAARKQQVLAGQAVRVSASGETASPIPLDPSRFAAARTVAARSGPDAAVAREPWPQGQPIWLGNLFDDACYRGASLAAAIKTDEFRARAEGSSLGVDRVLYAGSPVKQIAPGVSFDAANLGWQDIAVPGGHVTNDAWTDANPFADEHGPRGGIRTQGKSMGFNEPRIEEGIGQHANALITFDLDAIRLAGGLAGQALEFRCDRAGINDGCIGDSRGQPASVHMAAIVSSADGIGPVVVDGRSLEFAKRDDVWRVTQAIGEPLRADGRHVEFQVSLRADAKWLTLLSASAGDGHLGDHAVWSGARLEAAR